MTWLDKLKKRKGPPQWPKEEAIDHGIEQLTKLMPKGSRAVDAEKRGKMREKFNEAIHPHWHKTEGVDWDKVVPSRVESRHIRWTGLFGTEPVTRAVCGYP